MDPSTIDDWRKRIERERARTGPPPGFPVMPDIPAGRYTDPGFFAAERNGLWRQCWLYAAHSDQLSASGDFIVWRHGSAPIVLIHADDGQVRAFYNTCRHRGAPLLRSPEGNAPKQLVCGYHGWTYDRQGRLKAVSEPRDWPSNNTECRDLVAVRCERFGNWFFVNENPDVEPLERFLAPVARFMSHLPLTDLRLVHRREIKVKANAKVLLENFLEAYHFNLLHANTTHRIFDNRGTSIHLWAEGHSMMLSPNRRDDWVDPGTIGMPEMAEATDIERFNNPSYCIFPNLILPISPTGMPAVTIWPVSIDESVLEVLWFAPGDEAGQHEELWKDRIANFDRIVEEDIQFAAPIQASLDSPGFKGVPLSYQERRIYHWHEQLDRYLADNAVGPELRVKPILEPFVE